MTTAAPWGPVETITDISELDYLDQRLGQLSRQLEEEKGFYGIIGQSNAMLNVFEVVTKAAQSRFAHHYLR